MLKWEQLEQDHAGYIYRARVPGGWLVKEVLTDCRDSGYEWRSSLVFIPDPDRTWGIVPC